MDYKLEMKPFERKDGLKYKVIHLTDIALHTNEKRIVDSSSRGTHQAFSSGIPWRIHVPIDNHAPSQQVNILDCVCSDPSFIEIVRKEEEKGYVILLSLSKCGTPILAGKDTMGFIESKNGKRIIRALARNKLES